MVYILIINIIIYALIGMYTVCTLRFDANFQHPHTVIIIYAAISTKWTGKYYIRIVWISAQSNVWLVQPFWNFHFSTTTIFSIIVKQSHAARHLFTVNSKSVNDCLQKIIIAIASRKYCLPYSFWSWFLYNIYFIWIKR